MVLYPVLNKSQYTFSYHYKFYERSVECLFISNGSNENSVNHLSHIVCQKMLLVTYLPFHTFVDYFSLNATGRKSLPGPGSPAPTCAHPGQDTTKIKDSGRNRYLNGVTYVFCGRDLVLTFTKKKKIDVYCENFTRQDFHSGSITQMLF